MLRERLGERPPRGARASHDVPGGEVPCKPGWVLDELATAGRENLDPVHASQYDRKQDARAAEEVQLLVELGLDQTKHVVDLGAGTGQFAVAAADVSNKVIAVDVSEVMLTQLRAKVTEAGISNIEVVNAGFVTYRHQGRPADFVYSRWALHQIPDFWKSVALVRMRRALRPGVCFGCPTSSTPSTLWRPRPDRGMVRQPPRSRRYRE